MTKPKKPYVWVEQAAVISALRRIFRRYPPYNVIRNSARVEWSQPCKNGNMRRRVSFMCAHCEANVSSKEFAVDHTNPVIDLKDGFVDYNTFVKRLFCAVDNLKGLCHNCHKIKSAKEAATRAKARKERKDGTRS